VPSNDIVSSLAYLCRETDRAAAALIKDLKDRSLLDSTLVVWGGEFGRTP
jgi:arylsulfatase A-like enzyme